ncbi:UxaA family hydrolase [Paraburkholderia caffeinilytica]|uniref:UxaA family hydrolase n=1 Tax=Paraburkholderia caffeinilytica TaxID=1761016 RepID=UPI0038BBA66B
MFSPVEETSTDKNAPQGNEARVIRLNPADDVVISLKQLVSGTVLADEGVTVSGLIPPGHKVATCAIAVGEAVRRYGQIIGFTRQPLHHGNRFSSANPRQSAWLPAHTPTQSHRAPSMRCRSDP